MFNHIRNKHIGNEVSLVISDIITQSLGKALQIEREKTRLGWWGINRRGESNDSKCRECFPIV